MQPQSSLVLTGHFTRLGLEGRWCEHLDQHITYLDEHEEFKVLLLLLACFYYIWSELSAMSTVMMLNKECKGHALHDHAIQYVNRVS